MDPITGALISGGVRLLSGLFGNNARKKEARRAEAYDASRLQRLRVDAEKAGVNMLTALRATGGQGYGAHNASIDFGFIGDAVSQFVRDIDPIDLEARRLQNDLMIVDLKNARGFASNATVSGAVQGGYMSPEMGRVDEIEFLGAPRGLPLSMMRPQHRPSAFDDPSVPVFSPYQAQGDDPILINAGLAQRLNLSGFNTMTQGDFAEAFGEATEIPGAINLQNAYEGWTNQYLLRGGNQNEPWTSAPGGSDVMNDFRENFGG